MAYYQQKDVEARKGETVRYKSVKDAIQKARQDAMLLPVRGYLNDETDAVLNMKMPVLKDGQKHYVQCQLPKRLIYYTFADSDESDSKKQRHGDEPKALFMLIPFGVWDLHFRGRSPGWTWTAPEIAKADLSIQGSKV